MLHGSAFKAGATDKDRSFSGFGPMPAFVFDILASEVCEFVSCCLHCHRGEVSQVFRQDGSNSIVICPQVWMIMVEAVPELCLALSFIVFLTNIPLHHLTMKLKSLFWIGVEQFNKVRWSFHFKLSFVLTC